MSSECVPSMAAPQPIWPEYLEHDLAQLAKTSHTYISRVQLLRHHGLDRGDLPPPPAPGFARTPEVLEQYRQALRNLLTEFLHVNSHLAERLLEANLLGPSDQD